MYKIIFSQGCNWFSSIVFLCLVVKFSTETDWNSWELIDFDFIAVLVGLKRKQENLEKWSVPIWGVGICNVKQRNLSKILQKKETPVGQMVLLWYSKTDEKKEGIEIKEKNHTIRNAEAGVRSSCGGRSIETGSRCGLIKASVCEREWWRLWERERERESVCVCVWWRHECERDGGVMVWSGIIRFFFFLISLLVFW